MRCQLVNMDDPQIPRDPLEFMLALHSMTDAEYNSWGVLFPMPNSSLRGWTTRSSTLLALCLLSLSRSMLKLLYFFSLFSLFVMTLNVRNCNKGDLLLVNPLILHISLGQSMLMAWMALLGSVLCPIILMLWAILSLPTLER